MRKAIVFIFICCALLFLLQQKWYMKNKKWQPDNNITARLAQLGDSAISTLDVPVAAILLYNGKVIGEGYNTVKRNKLAGGHAEINALSDAINKMGVDAFMNLDREALQLVTTWEPCPMCKGAILEYNIVHVVVITPKSLRYWLQQWKKEELYEWNKQVAATDTLQENMFRKHPEYNKQKAMP